MDAASVASFLARCVAELPALGGVAEVRTGLEGGGSGGASIVELQAALEVCAEVLVCSPRGAAHGSGERRGG